MITQELFGGAATVYGWGIDYANPDRNWSLRDIEKPGSRDSHAHVFDTLREIKAGRIWAPSPTEFNSKIITENIGVTSVIALGPSTSLRRGQQAEGALLLYKSEAFAVSSADCALLVVMVEDVMFACHAGRDSCFDRKLIDEGEASKEHSSIVTTLISMIKKAGGDPGKASAFIGFGISPGHHFRHSVTDAKYGEKNKNLLCHIAKEVYRDPSMLEDESFGVHGEINMPDIIKRQLMNLGVPEENIKLDGRCTFRDTNGEGQPLWFSQPRTPTMRNLFVVVRNS